MRKSLTLAAAAVALVGAQQMQADVLVFPQYTLTYDPTDGSLTIDTFGNVLYTYQVVGLGAPSVDDGFIETNHVLLGNAPGSFGPPANTSSDDNLSQSDFDGWTGLGPFSIGNVLPPNLNESQFFALVDNNIANTHYVDEIGGQVKKAFDITFVPEPTSLVLLAVGGAIICRRRRD